MSRSRVLAAMVAATLAAGCAASPNDGAADAPIARAESDPWVVLNAPDRFPNIAFRCFGPNGIYAPRNADGAASRMFQVVPNDPQCEEKR